MSNPTNSIAKTSRVELVSPRHALVCSSWDFSCTNFFARDVRVVLYLVDSLLICLVQFLQNEAARGAIDGLRLGGFLR